MKMAKKNIKEGKNKGRKDKAENALRSMLKNYSELQKEYDLSEEHSTKGVLRKMGEHLEGYVKILIQILQPEEFHSLHECTVFDDVEKEQIFELYKSLMITHREILKAEIMNDEKNNIATIDFVHSELKNLKPKMLEMIKKMQDSWKSSAKKGKERYFG
jgi:hypothetical protein